MLPKKQKCPSLEFFALQNNTLVWWYEDLDLDKLIFIPTYNSNWQISMEKHSRIRPAWIFVLHCSWCLWRSLWSGSEERTRYRMRGWRPHSARSRKENHNSLWIFTGVDIFHSIRTKSSTSNFLCWLVEDIGHFPFINHIVVIKKKICALKPVISYSRKLWCYYKKSTYWFVMYDYLLW